MMTKRIFLQTLLGGLAALGLGTAAGCARTQTADAAGARSRKPGRRIAFVFVSRTGHTESVGQAVKAQIGCDMYRVETVRPYPKEYRPATEVVKAELEQGIVREIKPVAIDLAAYDTVILGTPTWWHHVAMPLQTWIRSVDLKGKQILTCNTHGGGGRMNTREDFEKLLKDAGVELGTHLTVFGDVPEDDYDVRRWLKENGLL